MIAVLDKVTIDKIAAGEVIERPASIVKELLENALDSGADSICVEIKDGGRAMIRVTDNGCSIPKKEVKTAFLRHSTSKIRSAEDLQEISSLGFRGEALSSIAAVSRVEIIAKTQEELTGIRYGIEGGEERFFEEIGAPEGTTLIVRDVFFNTPARRKFLKSDHTEAAHIGDLVEKIALSRPFVAFRFISQRRGIFETSGKGRLKDAIHQIYGREISSFLLPVEYEKNGIRVSGYIGRPELARGSRAMETYFVNGRYVKDKIVCRALEEGYADRMMQHKYPVCVLHIATDPSTLDVNVHPAKTEIRFFDSSLVYRAVREAVEAAFEERNMIREGFFEEKKEERGRIYLPASEMPEPFEKKRERSLLEERRGEAQEGSKACPPAASFSEFLKKEAGPAKIAEGLCEYTDGVAQAVPGNTAAQTAEDTKAQAGEEAPIFGGESEQLRFLSPESSAGYRIVGQIFRTYWIIEFCQKIYIIDQHAAHEKVLYEKFLDGLQRGRIASQMLSPPLLLTLTPTEEDALVRHKDLLLEAGFEIEHFGGKQYGVYSIPSLLPSLSKEELIMELIAQLCEGALKKTPDLIREKIAGMSCKAAVKGNQELSEEEVRKLIEDLLLLENPYNCPHGRPTLIEMSRYELEKKFKRIV